MTKKVSMQQIADRLGLSKYSVSQALSGKQGVSEETREKVIEMAKAMGYSFSPASAPADNRQSAEAGQPVGERSFVLIWTKPDQRRDISFWNRVISGIIDGCELYGRDHLIISNNTGEQEFEFPPYADRSSCVGVILLGSLTDSTLLAVKKLGLPVVLADHYAPFLGIDCVVNANLEAAKTVCLNVIASKAGSIVFVGDDGFSVSFSERRWGCQIAVMEENEKNGSNVAFARWTVPYRGPWRHALETEIKHMTEDNRPDCFICANDDIAVGLLTLLRNYEYSVPGQFKVVGFDDIEMAAHSNPPLTTVDFGKEDLGFRTIEVLERRIAKPDSAPEKVVLSFRLVVRQSG